MAKLLGVEDLEDGVVGVVLLLGGLLAALLCGKVGKRSNKRLVKSHKKLRSV